MNAATLKHQKIATAELGLQQISQSSFQALQFKEQCNGVFAKLGGLWNKYCEAKDWLRCPGGGVTWVLGWRGRAAHHTILGEDPYLRISAQCPYNHFYGFLGDKACWTSQKYSFISLQMHNMMVKLQLATNHVAKKIEIQCYKY